uniref:GLOBIN domain-containing protein n=1 Tax=Angiostrongylus cantonensis TaxID=6313 RepID=A0A0K0D1S8_ANGCA
MSSTLKHYNYDDKLNRLQRRALRFTWHRLHTRNGGKRVENVFEEVYDRLVRVLPSVKDIFTTRMFLCAMSRNETASLRDHARNSKREDTGSPLDPRIIGRSHGLLRPYGLTGQHWEKLGEIIIDVVLAQEAVRDLPGAGQAWVIFTACLVDQLRAGFDECRGANQGLTKRNTVLYNATKHLYDLVSAKIRLTCEF